MVKPAPTLRGGGMLMAAALPLGMSQVAVQLYYNVDIIILGITHGDVVAGQYSSAYGLMLLSQVFGMATLTAYFPSLYARAADDTSRRRVNLQFLQTRIMLAFPLAVLCWAVGDYGATFLYGAEFAEAGRLLRWLAPTIAFIAVNGALNEPLAAWNLQRLHMVATLVGAGANVLMNLFVIPRYGAVGAALTTVASEALVLLVLAGVRRRHLPVPWLKDVCFGVGVSVAAALVLRVLTQHMHWMIVAGLGVAAWAAAAEILRRRMRVPKAELHP